MNPFLKNPQTAQNPPRHPAPLRANVLKSFFQPREYWGRQAPTWLTRQINKVAGLNQFGEPRYRLVWAAERLTPTGGTFKDWPPNTPIRDRVLGYHLEGDPATGEHYRTPVKPLREVTEVRLTRRYPTEINVWVLERWIPPKAYGLPQQWYAPVSRGGTMIFKASELLFIPALGAYPFRGDYEFSNFSFTNAELSESSVMSAIGRIERHVEALRPIGVRIAHSLLAAQAEEEALEMKMDALASDIIEEYQPAFGMNPFSSGAGTKGAHSSKTIAKRLGIREHLGVD